MNRNKSHKSYKSYKSYKKHSKRRHTRCKRKYVGGNTTNSLDVTTNSSPLHSSNNFTNSPDSIASKISDKIGDKIVNQINDASQTLEQKMNDPQFVNNVNKLSENVGILANIAEKSIEEPMQKFGQAVAKSTQPVMEEVAKSLPRVIGDFVVEIPFIGSIYELGRIANDSSAMVANVLDKSKDVIDTATDSAAEMSENFNRNLHNEIMKKNMNVNVNPSQLQNYMRQQQNERMQSLNRTQQNLNMFKQPMSNAIVRNKMYT